MVKSDKLHTHEVFGVSASILDHSYVDRGELDKKMQKLIERPQHIALRGESKCGKSWLRQKNIPDAIVVQCRLNKNVGDVYVDALSQLGVKLTLEESSKNNFKGVLEATQELGVSLLAKIGFKQSASFDDESSKKSQIVGHTINDLKYVAEIIKESGRRLVIEDFHYLNGAERKAFAFDLKAMWDYECFVVVIGIWTDNNLLLHLNPDLSGRIEELSIFWRSEDLISVIEKGSKALNLSFSQNMKNSFVVNAFGTVGILQTLILKTLDNVGIDEEPLNFLPIDNVSALEAAGMDYAEQLNALYQTFATRVAKGIRIRKQSTGIYAHTMAVIMATSDENLSSGLNIDEIFKNTHAREGRIQKGNLRTILEKLDKIQVDDDGRGLVISYDPHKEEISVVDRQLFLYRKYATVKWPWENIINSIEFSEDLYESDNDND